MCAQKVHTYVRTKMYQKQCYVFNVRIAIITLTSEYRGTVTNFRLHSSQGRLTRGSVCQALLKDFWKLHYIFILLLSSTLLHTGVWWK
jgi:hypothetical protein